MPGTVAFRVLGTLHVLAGVAMLPFSVLLGLSPVLAAASIWLIVLGVRLWRPGRRVLMLTRTTHRVTMALAVLMMVYGMFALRAAARSAARGGGLLGGFGLLPLGAGMLLAFLAAISLWMVARAIASDI